jgi:hypothetical protein
VRRVWLAIALLSSACRQDAATGTATSGGSSRPGAQAGAIAAHPARVSDDELAAFTRWQRDYVELFSRHRAELDAIGTEDPASALRDKKAFEARVAEVVARQVPVMKAHLDRHPLKDARVDLVTEAVGGVFHYEYLPSGYKLVVARDEIRLDAARRRFGPEAIDDIVAREPLILAALRNERVEEPPR